MSEFAASEIFLVTGASSGIGRACALALNSAGAAVICNGRNISELEKTQDMAEFPDRIRIEALDLAKDLGKLNTWILGLAQKYGNLQGLVNSAGITWNAPLSFYNLDKVRQIFDLCCHAPLILSGSFCSRRINSGKDCAIVNIAAAAALDPNPGQGAYSAAKAALIAGSGCLAKETAKAGIRVNCVSPGLVEGPMLEATCGQLGTAFLEREKERYPLGLGKPEHIAATVLFLLSRASAWITGQNFAVTGGRQ